MHVNNYKHLMFTCLLALFGITLLLAIRESFAGFFHLPWAGRQILPTILFLDGFLQTDFYTLASVESPYVLTAYLLQFSFSENPQQLALEFSLAQALFNVISTSVTTVLVCFITLFIYQKLIGRKASLTSFEGTILLSIIGIFLILGVSRFLPWIWPNSAGWSLPIFSLLNPLGLTWVMMCIITILILMIWDQQTSLPIEKKWNKTTLIFFSISCTLMALSSLLHPVTPLMAILTLGQLSLLEPKRFWQRFYQLFYLGLVWAGACIILVLMFDSGEISSNMLYEIYVKERHPHHYEPSFYAPSLLTLLPTFTLMICALVWLRKQSANKFSLFIMGFAALAIMPHLLQYIFAELLRVDAAIKFGPSRLIMVFCLFGLAGFGLLLIQFLFFINKKFMAFSIYHKVHNLFAATREKNVVIFTCFLGVFCCFFWVYKNTLSNFEKAKETHIEYHLAGLLTEQDFDQYQLVNLSNEILHSRELIQMPVYIDAYFPFSAKHMKEWSRRQKIVQQAKNCITLGLNKMDCLSHFDNEGSLLILTSDKVNANSMKVNEEDRKPPLYLTKLHSKLNMKSLQK